MGLLKLFEKNIIKIAPCAFILLTFLLSIARMPFYDETHALVISRLNFAEIFELTRIEGHPMLWYLLLKPFNNINLYPWMMNLINWVFASLMIIVLWRFAPLNNFIKFLLTFSYPFFQFFGLVSRPYTLAGLIIFLLTVFYNNSHKKPLIYSSLLILCANISVISAFVAFGFGVIFIYEIIKNKIKKKDFIFSFLILLLGILLLLLQFYNFETPKMQNVNISNSFIENLKAFIFLPFSRLEDKNIVQILFQFFSFISIYYFSFLFFKTNKKALVLFFLSIIPMIALFCGIYVGDFWHYYFIFIVFICVMWINWQNVENIKIANILFIILILLNMTSFVISKDGNVKTQEAIFYKKALEILKKDKYKNAKLFYFNDYTYISSGLLLYLEKENIKLHDMKNNEKSSFESIKNIRNSKYRQINPEELYNFFDKTKENYLIETSNNINDYKDFAYEKDDIKIYFKLTEYYPELYLLIYKVNYEK